MFQEFDEEEIKKNGGIVYDPSSFDYKDIFPNAHELVDQIIPILEFMLTEEMIQLRDTNEDLFGKIMEEKFDDFADKYYNLFMMILSGQDLEPLFKMLKELNKVNKGKDSIQDVEKKVGLYLGKSFLPESLLNK